MLPLLAATTCVLLPVLQMPLIALLLAARPLALVLLQLWLRPLLWQPLQQPSLLCQHLVLQPLSPELLQELLPAAAGGALPATDDLLEVLRLVSRGCSWGL